MREHKCEHCNGVGEIEYTISLNAKVIPNANFSYGELGKDFFVYEKVRITCKYCAGHGYMSTLLYMKVRKDKK